MGNSKILYLSIVVSLAGFLFGFDTVVISGAEKSLQALWDSSDLFHGMVVMSSALWGTVIGAVFGSVPTNKLGRRKTLIAIGLLFFVSAVGSSLVSDPYIFAAFRFIGGLGIGISTVVAPAFVSEIAPPDKRGKLVAMYQFNIVFGILVAFISNYLFEGTGENSWRWMIGVEAFPALIYFALVIGVPESPRWLLQYKKDKAAAIAVLQRILPNADHQQLIKEMEAGNAEKGKQQSIFLKKFRTPLLLAFFIALFNQLSGINAFLYYAPRVFELAGLNESESFLSSILVGGTNLVFTLVGISMIDKFGRKTLMYLGSVGYIISLGLVSLAFALDLPGSLIPIFFFLFIASHAIGQGAVIWVFIAEIFPNKLRASGSAFGSSVHWVLAAAIPALIPFLFTRIGPGVVFGIFCFFMVLQLVWVKFYMPETKGQPLEELAEKLSTNKK